VTEEQAAAALKLRNSWLDFRDRLATVTTQIVLRLEPALERLMAWLQRIADWVAEHQDDISKWVNTGADALLRFAQAADGAAQSVGGWKTVLAGLLALKIVGFAASLLTLAGSLTGIASGLGLISAAGPAALAVLAGVGVYAAAKHAEPKADDGPLKPGEKVGKKAADDTLGPREFWLRTLASTGDARAAKELYQMTGRNDYSATWTPEKGKIEKAPVKYKRGEGGMSEIIDRTLASLGNVNAGIRIKNATGVDDYNVGDAKLDDKPKARNAIAGGRALMDLPRSGATAAPTDTGGTSSWQIPPGVQVERDRERLRILQEELGRATNEKDRAALMREIQRTQSSISTGSGNIQPISATRNYLQSVGAGGAVQPAASSRSTEVNISGPITISAPGGDPQTIAREFTETVRAKIMAAQSDTGLD